MGKLRELLKEIHDKEVSAAFDGKPYGQNRMVLINLRNYYELTCDPDARNFFPTTEESLNKLIGYRIIRTDDVQKWEIIL